MASDLSNTREDHHFKLGDTCPLFVVTLGYHPEHSTNINTSFLAVSLSPQALLGKLFSKSTVDADTRGVYSLTDRHFSQQSNDMVQFRIILNHLLTLSLQFVSTRNAVGSSMAFA